MSEPNQPQTLDEVFPILARIESVPLADCKAAYDRLDTSSPGEQIDSINKFAPRAKSTREFLTVLWPGNFQSHARQHCDDFALMVVRGFAFLDH